MSVIVQQLGAFSVQEALHRIDTKLSLVNNKTDVLVDKTDALSVNQALYMRSASSVTPSSAIPSPLSGTEGMSAVITPEPAKKKPRLMTLFYSPATPQSSSSNTSMQVCNIQFVYDTYNLYNYLNDLYTNCIGGKLKCSSSRNIYACWIDGIKTTIHVVCSQTVFERHQPFSDGQDGYVASCESYLLC